MPTRSMTAVALALSVLLVPAAIKAEDVDPPIDCANALSTHDMNFCADKELERADSALNEVYKKALASIPEMASEPPYDAKGWEAALRASQRAWVTFRDAECNDHVAMFWTGGTGATGEILGCKTEKTEQRTKELKDRYEAP